jgi:hypothetical protein
MRITRRQLRQLIESSVIKRDDDYVAPVEAPLTDPRDFDFDLSDENKKKFFDLAGGDDASQAQADAVADALDFPSSGRFGADTFSKQMKMYDIGLDVINDPEVDQLLDRAIELYFNDYGHYVADDLIHVLQAGYEYPEGPGGFQLFLNGDPDFNKANLNTELDVVFFHPRTPAIRTNMVYAAMRKMYFLIATKLTIIQDSMRKEETLAPEYLRQRFEKFKKAKELFKSEGGRPPALVQHVYDKMMKPMYELFTTAHKKSNLGIDMNRLKESKLKVSRRKLAGMHRVRNISETLQLQSDLHNLTGDNMKLNRKSLRRLIMEELGRKSTLTEAAGDIPYRARIMLGLVPGVAVLATDAIEDPFNPYSEDEDHRTLYFAIQDLADAVMSGQQNTTGEIQLRPEKLQGGERLPYLMDKIRVAKSILMDSDNPDTPRRWFIREEDALVHFVTNLEQVLS